MADASQQNSYELENLLPDHQAEAKQDDVRIRNDMGNEVVCGRVQQEKLNYVSSGRVSNGNTGTGAELTDGLTDGDDNEVDEIFIEDSSFEENGRIEIAETESSKKLSSDEHVRSAGSTSNPDQQENANHHVASGRDPNNGNVSNNGVERNEPSDNEIEEIFIDGSLRKIGGKGVMGHKIPARNISVLDVTDTESEDSDYDKPILFCQERENTDEDSWRSAPDTPTNLSCCSKLRCRSRSDTLREKFNELFFNIHNHYVEEMEDVLKTENIEDQAQLLVMESKEGLTCLMKAITRQSFSCLKSLLETLKDRLKDNPNHIKPLGGLEAKDETNLFHLAAEFVNQTEIIDYLLEHCPSKAQIVNKADRKGATPLLVACKTRNYITMKRLVKEPGAKIDHIDRSGNSPIYYAAKSECAKTLTLFLKMFLKQGHSDEDYKSLFTNTKLYGGKGTILQALLESKSSDTLWKCFENEREQELIRKCLLIELEKDSCFLNKVCCQPLVGVVCMASHLLHKRDEKDGMTPLITATVEGQFEIVEFILADENGRNSVSGQRKTDKRNALMIACEKDFDEIAKLIMKQRSIVELDAVDKTEQNVFHIAAKNPKVLEAILVCSANYEYDNYKETLKAKDRKGYTPLHYAAAIGSSKNVKLLLRHKVPYDIAHPRTARLALHEASYTNLSTVKALVNFVQENRGEEAKKKFINASDDNLQTSLHIAASDGKYKTVEYLLKNGATIKSDYQMETPLHLAAASGCTKTLDLLLRHTPSVIDHQNRVGETPVMFAALEGKAEALQVLFDYKAKLQVDSSISVKNPKTCLEWAVKNTKSDTASIILDHRDWKKDMIDASVGADGLLAMMVKSMPQLATAVLSKCVKLLDYGEKEFDFFALQTVKGEESNSNDDENQKNKVKDKVISMQAIEAMIDNSSDQCLRHVVVQEFLNYKWTKRIRKWYLTVLSLYIVFLLTLTTYIGLVKGGAYSSNGLGVRSTRLVCAVSAGVCLITEIVMLRYRKLTYQLSTFVAYVNISTMYITVFIFLPHSNKSERQWEAGAIAIFLAWINFISFLKRIPEIGIYMIMVKKIFVTFVKVLIPVMFFIIAFAMTFFTLDCGKEVKGFETIPHSLLTSFAMMAGEINYHESDGFLGTASGRFGWTVTVFWVISVIVLTILITNLLTALAVGDTGKILRRSIEEKRLQRAIFVVDLEKFLNKLPFMGANFVETQKEKKSQKSSRLKSFCNKLKEAVCPKFIVEERSDEEATQLVELMEQLVELKTSLAVIQKHVLTKDNKQRKPSEFQRLNSRKLVEKQRSYHGTRSQLPSSLPVSRVRHPHSTI